MDLLATTLSISSVFLYSVTYFPQIRLIIVEKSVEGLSLLMLCLWIQADFLALMATILLQLPLNLILIDIYHIIVSLITIYFVLLFKNDLKNVKIFLFVLVNTLLTLFFNTFGGDAPFLGNTLAWITSVCYIGGRFPQIIKNNERKSVEGLSAWMYILTILANGCYLLSMSMTGVYLQWVILICSSILLDLVVLYQFRLYTRNTRNTRNTDIELGIIKNLL
jgi:uncharacterized protein with PQ loop repeat